LGYLRGIAASAGSPCCTGAEAIDMEVNRQDHPQSMELLRVKRRLKKSVADPKERQDIKERIRELERDLKLD